MKTIKNPYKLDKIFTEEYLYKVLPIHPINKITNLQELLNDYRLLIKNKEKDFNNKLIYNTDQIYTGNFFFDDDQYYDITWNKAKAKEIIAINKIPKVDFELNKLSDTIFEKDINKNHLVNARKNHEPIIVAFFEPTQKYIPIDGNHRAYAKLIDEKKTIEAYVLQPRLHMESMCSQLDIALYIFAYNLNLLISHMCGIIDEQTTNELMYLE